MTENYNGLEVFSYQFDRFAYEHPWIGAQAGEFMLGPEGGGMLEFTHATVFALPEGGAHEVHGPILDWYLGHGDPMAHLGIRSATSVRRLPDPVDTTCFSAEPSGGCRM